MKLTKRGEHEVYNAAGSAEKPLVFFRWKGNGEIAMVPTVLVLIQ